MNKKSQRLMFGRTRQYSLISPLNPFTATRSSQHSIWCLSAVTFVVAACSILYELLLAQTLSTIMGNTLFRYNLTIGIYIASLGIGALFFSRLNALNIRANLIITEITLSVVGFVAPVLVIMVDHFFQRLHSSNFLDYHHWVTQSCIFCFNHGLIILIGFVSGLELPLLMHLSKHFQPHYSNKILIVDYFGTIFGSILFPLILVPLLNLFTIAQTIGLVNAVVALLLSFWLLPEQKKWQLMSGILVILMIIALIFAHSSNQWIIETFYYG